MGRGNPSKPFSPTPSRSHLFRRDQSKRFKTISISLTQIFIFDFAAAGDCVSLRPTVASKPIMARVERIEPDNMNGKRVHVRWYYRPEEAIGGRKSFHGDKELFLSDHHDVHSADTIEGKYSVYTLKKYTKLATVGAEDYFCRFRYKVATGAFKPDPVRVFCTCELPYNPDRFMAVCDTCNQRFHPECVGIGFEKAMRLQDLGFVCSDCYPSDLD